MTRTIAPVALLLVLAACSKPEQVELSDEDFTRMAEALPVPAPENPDAKAVRVHDKDRLIDFTFAYPAEAAAIPKLKIDLDERLEAARATLRSTAEQEDAMRRERGMEFRGVFSKTEFETLGNAERLLSLLGSVENYTGGAHGNRGSSAILWDRVEERPVDVAVLFGTSDRRDTALREEFCRSLAEQRRARIGDIPDDSWADCPDLDAVTVAPADRDGDGRFDLVRMVVDPYVAGPWAEGDYRVDLVMDAPRVAAIAEPYRGAFGQ